MSSSAGASPPETAVPPVVVDPSHGYHPPLPAPPPRETPYSPANWESYAFSADIAQLLSLIIDTFYSNKEVFLRELLSNASDALDKLRYQSLLDPTVLGEDSAMTIRIVPDKEAGTLLIADTGVGMTKSDLVHNLGTIARSGTKSFMEALSAGADLSMIGQFGVGFYSAFLVADRVQVHSRSRADEQWCWESDASGNFKVGKDALYPDITRGTHVLLFLKADQRQSWTDERTIRQTVKRHNEFIQYPIYLKTLKEVDAGEEEAGQEAKTEGKTKEGAAVEGERVQDVTDEEEERKKKTTRKVRKEEWELLNTTKPIWTSNPSDVKDEEYEALYKTLTNDWEGPLTKTHFKTEKKKQSNLRLYVRRVFVTDDCKDFCPEYLSFLKGLVDSEDLPLNISRESLQVNRILAIVRKHVVKKAIDSFVQLQDDEERYRTFYDQFSKNLKLGVHEDSSNRARLAELLRFFSSHSPDKWTTLKEYVQRMKEGQKGIYYLTGESKEHVARSPFLEGLQKRGLEVLFLTDPIDEEFDGKPLKDASKEDVQLLESEEEKREEEEEKKAFEVTLRRVKEVLGERVEKVTLSHRMTSSPCVLVTGEFGWSANMERIMRAQALRDTSMSSFMVGKKTLELNPHHRLIRALHAKVEGGEKEGDGRLVVELVHLLYDTALLVSGFSLPDPAAYAQRIHKLVGLGLGVEGDDEAEEAAKTADRGEAAEGATKEEPPPLVDEGTVMEEVD